MRTWLVFAQTVTYYLWCIHIYVSLNDRSFCVFVELWYSIPTYICCSHINGYTQLATYLQSVMEPYIATLYNAHGEILLICMQITVNS